MTRISQANGARLIAAHEKALAALRSTHRTANTTRWIDACEQLGKAEAAFTELVSKLTEPEA